MFYPFLWRLVNSFWMIGFTKTKTNVNIHTKIKYFNFIPPWQIMVSVLNCGVWGGCPHTPVFTNPAIQGLRLLEDQKQDPKECWPSNLSFFHWTPWVFAYGVWFVSEPLPSFYHPPCLGFCLYYNTPGGIFQDGILHKYTPGHIYRITKKHKETPPEDSRRCCVLLDFYLQRMTENWKSCCGCKTFLLACYLLVACFLFQANKKLARRVTSVQVSC